MFRVESGGKTDKRNRNGRSKRRDFLATFLKRDGDEI